MSIFSRLFQKEDGDGDDTPPDGIGASGDVAASDEVVASGAAAQPEGEMTGSSDKTAPIKIPDEEVQSAPPVVPPSLPMPAGKSGAVAAAPKVPPPLPRRAQQARREKSAMTPSPALTAGLASTGADAAIDHALDNLFPTGPNAARPSRAVATRPAAGVSTDVDRAAVKATFEDLAVAHVRPVRNMMIDLKWGEPLAAWLDVARPALKSLRQMAEQVEVKELCAAIDTFSAALDEASRPEGTTTAAATRDALLTAYAPLSKALPAAFELEGERDRREPIIVQSLLKQTPGLDPLMMQRLYAVGLGQLETLLRATAEEVAVVADLPASVASAVVSKVQELRRGPDAVVDLPSTARVVRSLLRTMQAAHQAHVKAAAGWSADSVAAKRQQRKEREAAFLQVRVLLARAGEVDLVTRLEPLPYARRIDELDRFVRATAGTVAQA